MATARPPVMTPAPQDAHRIDYEQFIEQQIRRTRGTVKLVDLVSRIMAALAALTAVLLAVALVEHWLVPGGLSIFWRSFVWLALVAAGGWFLWRQIAPLIVQRISAVYAAQAIESHSAGLKNSLLNFLLFRQHREFVPEAVYRTVEEQAATRLAAADVEAAVDRSGLIRVGYVLLALVVLGGLYKVLSPKDPVASAGRVLLPWADIPAPTRVLIQDVEPGEIRVARGETVQISAVVGGLREDESVVIRYSTEDGQAVDFPVEMYRGEGEYRYRGELPSDPPPGTAPGIQQPMTYFIEAGDARSQEFAIEVIDAPTIVLEQVEYDFPEYTGRATRTQVDDGDIRAIEGTRVAVRAQTNHPVLRAGIDLGADGTVDVPLEAVDGNDQRVAGEFVLELDPETRTQPHDLYALRFTDQSRQQNRNPVHYHLEIIPDLPPEVEILHPEAIEKEVRLGETVHIEVEARDPDYALAQVMLLGRTAEGVALEERLLEAEHDGRFFVRHPFTPRGPEFAVGDVLEYWVEVKDNRTPEANRAATDRRRLKIIEPPPIEDHPELADQGQGGPQQQQQQQQQQQGQGQNENQQQQGERQQAQGQQGNQEQQQQQGGQQDGEQQQQGEGGAQQQGGQDGAEGEPQQGGGGAQGDAPQGGQGGGEQPPDAGGPQNADPTTGQQDGGGGPQAGQQPAGNGQTPDQQPSTGQQSPGADGEPPPPVPSDGSDDGEAMRRMLDHFQEQQSDPGQQQQQQQQGQNETGQQQQQEGAQQAQQQEESAQQQPQEEVGEQSGNAAADGRETRDGEQNAQDQQAQQERAAQDGTPPGQNREPSTDQQTAEGQTPSGKPQQPDQTQQPRSDQGTPESTGAEGEAGRDATSDAGPQPDQQRDPSQASGPNNSQGPSGDGDQPGSNQGAPDPSNQQKPAEKRPQQGSGDQRQDDQEPSAPAQGRRESDSHGEQGGDEAGGGQEGGGQEAQRDGTGSDGQNQSADEGGGTSTEEGQGDPSTETGGDQQAGERTGQAGDQAGRGSQERTGEGNQPGGAQQQDADSAADSDGRPSPEQQENVQRRPQDGSREEAADPSRTPPDGQQSNGRNAGPGGGNPQTGGGQPGDSLPPSDAGGNGGPVGDEANLDYARKQTDLVLDRLENQLKDRQVDQELLDKMGWSEDDLRKFVDRWRSLKQAARSQNDVSSPAQRELDQALRALGPLRERVSRGSGNVPTDELRDLRTAPAPPVPAELEEEIRAYTRGISRE